MSESEEESRITRLCIEFSKKYDALMMEAKMAGLHSLIVFHGIDELAPELNMRILHTGGYTLVSGMARYAQIVADRQLTNYSDYLFEDDEEEGDEEN